jgi:hypothetical protein
VGVTHTLVKGVVKGTTVFEAAEAGPAPAPVVAVTVKR